MQSCPESRATVQGRVLNKIRPGRMANLLISCLKLGDIDLSVQFIRNRRARRYILRVLPNKSVRVTLPRSGNLTFAREFLQQHANWVSKQLQRLPSPASERWDLGTEVLFRGQTATLSEGAPGYVVLAKESIPAPDLLNLRQYNERYLWNLAPRELPQRVFELASLHGFEPTKVCVRNQRSRWGSCSRRGTVSLNWRLIQTPESVRDYIILHELAHLRHMNHSSKFWKLVAQICPDHHAAEAWLKSNHVSIRAPA